MKKKALKLVSVICTIALVISLCPCFNVSAETVLDELTAEKLAVSQIAGNQVPGYIVADLTLPKEGIIWTSSNPDVISNEGVVTRPASEDAAVTLTADDGTTTKDFEFVVISKKTNVAVQESFCYDGLENEGENTDIFLSDAMIANGWVSESEDLGSEIVTDSDGNKSLAFRIGGSGKAVQLLKNVEKGPSGKININFDYKHPTGQTGNVYIVAVLENAAGEKVNAVIMNIGKDNWFAWGYNGKGNSYWTRVIDRTSFQPVSIELDLNELTYTASYGPDGYYGDANYQTSTCTDNLYNYFGGGQITGEYDKLVSLKFWSGGTYVDCFDNIVISTGASVSASAVNFEMLTNQSYKAITKNLDFSKANALIEQMGGTLSWESSDNDILVVSDNTGVISRPAEESAEVTLTATVESGGKTTTKDFTFTVISKKVNVIAQESFNYEGLENPKKDINIFDSMTGWSNSKGTTASQIKTESNGNKYAELGLNAAGGAYIDWEKPVTADKVTLDFDLMLNEADKTWSATYITAILHGTDANGEPVSAQVRLAHIAPDRWMYWGNADNNKDYIRLNEKKMLPASIEIDLANKTVSGSLIGGTQKSYDGEKCTEKMVGYQANDNDVINNEGNTFTSVSLIRIFSNGSRNLDVDNFVLSTEAEEQGEEVDGALKIKVDGSRKQINITSVYDAEHTLTQSFFVRTDTNQHMEYCDQYLTDNNGNITKLWENDNYYRNSYPSDESAPLLINYRYFGGNHSTGCVVLTKAGHGKTLADVGTLWKDSSGNRWVLAEVADANRIKFVWAEPLPKGSFELYTYVDGGAANGTLTRWENDAATSETFNYTGQYGGQLFPIVRNSQQTVVAYNEDGTEVPVDLGTSQVLGAQKVVITDSYDITDPTAVAMSLYNNRPEGGYTEANRPDYTPGETVVAYKQIITILDDGTVLTEFDHEIKQELKMLTYFGIQYYMRNNLGGGVKRLMPGTKAFKATRSIYNHRDSIIEDTSKEYDFDFSVPAQLYRDEKGLAGTQQEHYMFNLPYYKIFDNTVWADENIVPNRVIDYMYDSDNNSDIAYAAGFLPLKDAAPDVRAQNTKVSFDVDGKAKAYPYLINVTSGEKLQPGAKIQGVAYRKFEDADRFDGNASVYSVPYDGKEYYYVDMFENGTVSFAADGATEENVIVSQNVGDAEVTVADGIITVTGDKKDYVEITVYLDGEVPDKPDVPDVPDLPDEPEVNDSDVTITTNDKGTTVKYKLSTMPESKGVTFVAALVSSKTGDVKEINWTVCEDLSLLEGDPKEISVSLTGKETETVKLHYYLCDNLVDLHSLKDFAPAEPDLKTVDAQIGDANVYWIAPNDDYESPSSLRYNIYDDGLLMNETPVSGLNYNVQNLVPGADYHFFVKALDSKNNESDASNMVKGSTYMPSTVTTRIKPKEDEDLVISKDGNLKSGPLASVLDTTLFYYKQDKVGGLNCFSSTACYQGTATGTPNYIRGISYLAFQLNNQVNADNVTYAYEFTYFDQCEETGQDAYLVMTYCTTRGRKDIRVKLTNDRAWKTVKGTFTAEKPLTVIGDGSAQQSQIMFSNSHPWNSNWCEDRPASGSELLYEKLYDEDYTKLYRMTLLPLVNGADETYNKYKKLAGASLTIENPAPGEAATIISGLDCNAKCFNSDSEENQLVEKDGRLAVALGDLNDKLTFTVTDNAVAGKSGNVEVCCFAEKETVVFLNDGSSQKIPANTWTKLRFSQDSVSNREYSITADNELYVSSLRVTAK